MNNLEIIENNVRGEQYKFTLALPPKGSGNPLLIHGFGTHDAHIRKVFEHFNPKPVGVLAKLVGKFVKRSKVDFSKWTFVNGGFLNKELTSAVVTSTIVADAPFEDGKEEHRAVTLAALKQFCESRGKKFEKLALKYKEI